MVDRSETLARTRAAREPAKAIPDMAGVTAHDLRHFTDDELAAMHAYRTALSVSGVPLR